jgi:hypothetical protein
MFKKLLIISLFISVQAFAIGSVIEELKNLPNILLGGAIQACGQVQSKAKEIGSTPEFIDIHSRAREIASQSWNYTEYVLERAQDSMDMASDWASEFGNQVATVVPQKAAEVVAKVKNNPYKTLVIIGGALAAIKLVKDALNSKSDNDGKTELVLGFNIGVKTPNPFKLAAGVIAAYYAYQMKNNIFSSAGKVVNFFTKKTVVS